MSAPLSAGAWEVLRALVLGVQIRESWDGWRAVDPCQIDSEFGSCVDDSHISELHAFGFIDFTHRGSVKLLAVSEAGLKALEERQRREIDELRKCLRSVKLERPIS